MSTALTNKLSFLHMPPVPQARKASQRRIDRELGRRESEVRQSDWIGFTPGNWQNRINVRDFIQLNYTPYEGDGSFLAGPTSQTRLLWEKVQLLMSEETAAGILDAETEHPSSITRYGAAYIDRDLEQIVGLQTDRPLKRAIMPYGGIRTVSQALEAYGYTLSEQTEQIFRDIRKTHNAAVFDVYTEEMRAARKAGIITGLPDAYGRGRIIGDYRRVALYGVERLIADKCLYQRALDGVVMDEANLRQREELAEQIRALKELVDMSSCYGFDIVRPAQTAQEAVQWTYFAYLGAIKEQDGAAMSLGRVSTFLDCYLERDLRLGLIDEARAQELIDHFVIKLRMVRFLRTPEYNELFSGDPTWVTESIGGIGHDGRPLVTKTSLRMLHTLHNLGPAPEPNLTVLWSCRLPEGFKRYCLETSIATSAIQYENDDLVRPYGGDDYGIACCVSVTRIGKQMQFFGARANLAKALLYAINGGRDELTGVQVAPPYAAITADVLDYDEVMERFERILDWLATLYMDTLNCIHFMHDKYCYERLQMALHDTEIYRTMACGIAGLSVVADSLSAIKHATVRVLRDELGLAVDYAIEGPFPTFGNNDDRVDQIAVDLVRGFMDRLRLHRAYRDATPTQSILTITSNVVYGKHTGSTPDGRQAGEPFAPGANPMHGRDYKGAVASMCSVAKLPYSHAQDGISYTLSTVPASLGNDSDQRIANLACLLDGYFASGGHHINVNCLDRSTLYEAMEHPERYPQLTIRVSGYAVHFVKLSREQQLDVIHRTFHPKL